MLFPYLSAIEGSWHYFSSKAVADGAVVWFVRHVVTARATRYAFGTDILVACEPLHPQKIGRTVIQTASGPYFDGGWREIVPRVNSTVLSSLGCLCCSLRGIIRVGCSKTQKRSLANSPLASKQADRTWVPFLPRFMPTMVLSLSQCSLRIDMVRLFRSESIVSICSRLTVRR